MLLVPVPTGTGGATKNSVVVCSQIRAIDQTRIIARLGTLPATIMRRIDEGLRAVLDLEAE